MSDEQNAPKDYLVGYARPPAQHRFRKGQSGNPAGRPRRSRNTPKDRFAFGLAPTRGLILDEAYRAITLRDGDRTITMPAIQAVMRDMTVLALKGNRLAQKNLAEFVQKVEASDFELRQKQFKSALDYKDSWEAEFRRCDAAGIPRPEPIPHPDDIILDVNTAGVRYRGPMTKADKELFNAGLDEAAALVLDVERLRRKSRRRALSAEEQAELDWKQRKVREVEGVLTPRYRGRVFGVDE